MKNLTTQYMTRNDCYIANRQIKVEKLMIHSTATKGIMAKDWFSRWNKSFIKGETNRQVCVHAFVDDKEVWQYLPWNHRAWHAGGSANNNAIGVEMCEDTNHTRKFFEDTIKNTVELFAFLSDMFGLDPMKDILSHREGWRLGVASNHGDPEHWIGKFGYTLDMFRSDVNKRLQEMRKETEAPKIMYRVIIDGKHTMSLSTLESAKAEVNRSTPEGKVGIVVRTSDLATLHTFNNVKQEERVMFRIIIDGKHTMSLSTLESAKAEVNKSTPKGKTGIVIRTTDLETLYTFENKEITPRVMYRVIIDGKHTMSLSTLESATEEVKKSTPENKVGIVQRTSDLKTLFTFDNKKPAKIMYRVIVDGKHLMSLSTFESARDRVVKDTPRGKIGIVQSTEGKEMFRHAPKALATWERHISGTEVMSLQRAVNSYFGASRLVVDGFYGDNTFNGVPNGIRKGMRGFQIIREIQSRLRTLGFYKDAIDGSFGNNTEKAVLALQKARGFRAVDQDGIVGRFTFSELYRR